MIRQKLYCLNVPGFCRGYTNGWESGYVEQAGFQPQPLGWGVIRVGLSARKALRQARGIDGDGVSLTVEYFVKVL